MRQQGTDPGEPDGVASHRNMTARGRPRPGSAAMAAAAMALGAAAWWWLGADRAPSAAHVQAGAVAGANGSGPSVTPGPVMAAPAPSTTASQSTEAASSAATALSAGTTTTVEATGDLQVPAPVPLQRSARSRQASPADAAPPPAAAVDLGGGAVAFGDAPGRSGRARFGAGAVTEAEIGLRAPPGAVPRPEDSSRVQDGSGSMLTATSFSGEPLSRLAAFYRAQFAAAAGEPAAQEGAPLAGQWSISAGDGRGGQRSVLLIQDGGQVRITVSRWQPGVAVPAVPAAHAGSGPGARP